MAVPDEDDLVGGLGPFDQVGERALGLANRDFHRRRARA